MINIVQELIDELKKCRETCMVVIESEYDGPDAHLFSRLRVRDILYDQDTDEVVLIPE